ncbi:DUF6309 family protein [Streptomyces sp. 21So2-11]|uniref:DUF6309 family protein n=1 Tax=Streptomyces sp. 21So2-11 TaxID=3144408 RepID=UPI0032190D4B
MKVLAPVPFAHVMRHFAEQHPFDVEYEENTNDEAEEHLRAAELTLGQWHRVALDRADVLAVILPWHLGEGGDRELIPKTGLTVGQTVARLRAAGEGYARANPVCGRKLDLQAASALTPVFLSTRAVPGVDYEGLPAGDRLTHLDGLHRMLAWELHGRLAAGVPMEAYVAGAPGGLAPADVRHGAGHDRDALDVHPTG